MSALDDYLAAQQAPKQKGGVLEAYLAAQEEKKERIERETAAGQTAPPTFLQKLGAAAFGSSDESNPAPPTEHPGFAPTAAESQEFEQLPWYRKVGRALSGNLPETNAADRGLRHEVATDPGKRGVMQLEDVGRNMAMIPFLGPAGAKVESGVAAAMPNLPRVAPYVADAATAAGVTAAQGAERRDSPGQVLSEAAGAALPAAGLGRLLRGGTNVSKSAADAIRDANTTTGADLRVLEKHGYEPAIMRPTQRMEEPPIIGPAQPPTPSKAMGVQPTSEGRGIVGERSASRFNDELAGRERMRSQRLRADKERLNQPGGQGQRDISVEPLIAQIDAELALPQTAMQPGVATGLKRVKAMLQGKVEPTAEIYSTSTHPYQNRPGVGTVEVPEPDPNYGVHERVPYDVRPEPARPASSLGHPLAQEGPHMYNAGERMEQPPSGPEQEVYRPLPRRVQSIGPEVTAHAGGEEPIQVGLGDIRARTGEAPNHIRTAQELDQIRDALDEAGNVAAQTGLSKKDLPFARLAHEIRNNLIKREAPAVGLANRRSSAVQRKTEITEERMKNDLTQSPESFGMQLAGQGESGSKVAGARQARLDELRRNFPTSSTMPREQVEAAMDAPRLLLAEERLKLKKLPRIGGGGTDAFNLSEPVLGRGLYNMLRGLERATPDVRRRAVGLLPSLSRSVRARDQEAR